MRRLVLDVDDWNTEGERLLAKDPTRFAAMLQLVREINEIQRDPFVKFDADDKAVKLMAGRKRGAA